MAESFLEYNYGIGGLRANCFSSPIHEKAVKYDLLVEGILRDAGLGYADSSLAVEGYKISSILEILENKKYQQKLKELKELQDGTEEP